MNRLLFVFTVLWSTSRCLDLCSICRCGPSEYYGEKKLFVTNCTGSGIDSENVTDMLNNMPINTEVLILKDNTIRTIPRNLFGDSRNFTKLRIIDMSNNQIEQIHGKSFHHAPAVERLILNHNSISLANPHPRVFSNFANLRELHLTNAFRDNQSDDLAEQLHSIFIDSNLTKLEKLHLEQNEIERFSDERVFCDLVNLLDLHLGDNKLQGLSFHILCLRHLRYLDLEGNRIQRFRKEDVAPLDSFKQRNQLLMLDISRNPFICDCNSNYLPSWLGSTRVSVKNNASLQCHYLNDSKSFVKLTDLKASDCNISSQYLNREHEEMHSFVNVFVFSLLCFLVIFLILLSVRYTMEFCRHPIRTADKVHYVVINNADDSKEAYI